MTFSGNLFLLLEAPYSVGSKTGIFTKIFKNSIPGRSVYDILLATVSTFQSKKINPYNPIGNDGYNFHTDHTTPYNYFEIKFINYYLNATHIVEKTDDLNYPTSFNISVVTTKGETKLVFDQNNSNILANEKYAYFPLQYPTMIKSMKMQLTDKRITNNGTPRDWALELFFFDIFGSLYKGHEISCETKNIECYRGQNLMNYVIHVIVS